MAAAYCVSQTANNDPGGGAIRGCLMVISNGYGIPPSSWGTSAFLGQNLMSVEHIDKSC